MNATIKESTVFVILARILAVKVMLVPTLILSLYYFMGNLCMSFDCLFIFLYMV